MVTTSSESTEAVLARDVSLPLLVLYGLGTTIGAGIYALTGEVAGRAGMQAPLVFLLAGILASTTGLGFAELAGRLPRAAGEAVFVDVAFATRWFTLAVGLAVVTAGVVAAATISVAFGGYMSEIVDVPEWIFVLALIVALGAVASSGVDESVKAAAIITVIEIVGLALVVWSGRAALGEAPSRLDELVGFGGSGSMGVLGVVGGAFLAFFAFFLGFEDIDAVAEETKDAQRTLPRAIVITLAITVVLYIVVSAAAVLAVDPALLARSDAPLSDVFEAGGGAPQVLSVFAGLAMVNGVLVQLVMIPRVVYGLSNLGLVPARIGAVSMRTQTPLRATLGGVVLVAALAFSLDLGLLARLTSGATMLVFIAVNAALVRIKRRDGATETFQVPGWLPWLGLCASISVFSVEVWTTLTP